MSDLIDRQAAIEVTWNALNTGDACRELRQLPSARRTGHWILHESQRQEDVDNGNYLYICSECGKSDIHAKTQDVPFCWWCGAEMD